MPIPFIPLLTTAAELGLSAAQLISAKANKKRIKIPSSEDSRQNTFLKELNQNRANLSTGSAYRSFIDSINQDAATATEQATKNSGGYTGAINSATNEIMATAGKSKAQLGGEALGLENTIDQERGAVISEMAKKKHDLGLLRYGQEEADYRENKQAGFSNLFATLASIDPNDYKSGKTSKPKGDNATNPYKFGGTDPERNLYTLPFEDIVAGSSPLNSSKGGFADQLLKQDLNLETPDPFSPLGLTGGNTASDWLKMKKKSSWWKDFMAQSVFE